MKNYPFIHCLDPLYVPNKVTGEQILVGCGKCPACQQLKSSALALKCKLESKCHKYCYFITLTYDETFLPCMVPVAVNGSKGQRYYFISTCKRLKDAGSCMCTHYMTKAQLDALQKKIGTPHGIPYLSVREGQLFVKRLRKYLKKYTDENIRYFICCEFGPDHLRPHYHLLVWFSREETRESIESCTNQAWKFGITDCQLTQGDASNYVAHYLNSFSSLPRIYAESPLRPFSCHSQFLGEKFYRSQGQEIYKLSASEFIRRSVRINGSISEFVLWRSLKNTFYPRCREYAILNPAERKRLYTCYAFVRKRKKSHRQPAQLAEEILNDIEHGIHNLPIANNDLYELANYYDGLFDIKSKIDDIITLQCDYLDSNYNSITDDVFLDILSSYVERRNYWKNVIYRDLAISKHFLEFVCNSNHPVEIDTKLAMIDYFYMALEYDQLTSSLRYQEEMLDDEQYSFGDGDYMLFYNTDICHLKHTSIYKKFRTDVFDQLNKSQKHKKQNDKNRILFHEVGLL